MKCGQLILKKHSNPYGLEMYQAIGRSLLIV